VRRLSVFFSLAVVALTASAAASAATPSLSSRVAGSEWIELWSGTGYAVVRDRGAVLGNVRRGWIRVYNLAGGGAPSGWVRGCEKRSGRLSGRLFCRGARLRLYIHGGTWQIRILGRGINVSGSVRGQLGLDRAERGTGKYRIGSGSSARRWPARLRFFTVRD
jgi:hypothetical protein